MGLDMYLQKKKKVEPIRIGYWRKFNALHNYLFEHFGPDGGEDNCTALQLSEEDIEETLNSLKYCLENKDKAEDEMPTQEGFFFGSTEYDDWYFENVKEAIDIFTKVLEETDWDNETVEYYAWY